MKVMKKLGAVLAALLLTASFVSCEKKPLLDEEGCYMSYDEARAVSEKKGKDLLVIVTMCGDDIFSSTFMETVFVSDQFKKEVAKKYVIAHLDFSQATYEKTVVRDGDSKKAQAKAAEIADVMQKDYTFANILGVQGTPSFYVFTKNGFCAGELNYVDEIQTYEGFKALLDSVQEKADSLEADFMTAKKGSAAESVQALDALYESSGIKYKIFYEKLFDEIVAKDKKNQSGLVGKYLYNQAETKAIKAFYSNDIETAVKSYTDVCENEFIDADHKQQAYYMAAYLLGVSGSGTSDEIIGYLEKSIAANPYSQNVQSIQDLLSNYEESLSEQEAADQTEAAGDVETDIHAE